MCSCSTPCWSATDAMQSLSQLELRKLGVMMENFKGLDIAFALRELPPAKAACFESLNRSSFFLNRLPPGCAPGAAP